MATTSDILCLLIRSAECYFYQGKKTENFENLCLWHVHQIISSCVKQTGDNNTTFELCTETVVYSSSLL